MTEKQVESSILEWLKWNGHWAMKIQAGVMTASYNGNKRYIHMAASGTPDILTCVNGVFVGIEVKKNAKAVERWLKIAEAFDMVGKAPKSYKREIDQHLQHKEIRKAGGKVCVVSSIEEVEEFIKSL